MIHYLYIGHFEHEDGLVRFANTSVEPIFRPVVSRPVNLETVEQLLRDNGASSSAIPDDWQVWIEDGYLVCDRHTHSREAIEFIVQLAKRTSCEIWDYSALSEIKPEELTYAWGEHGAMAK